MSLYGPTTSTPGVGPPPADLRPETAADVPGARADEERGGGPAGRRTPGRTASGEHHRAAGGRATYGPRPNASTTAASIGRLVDVRV